jgi:hypothetical protein
MVDICKGLVKGGRGLNITKFKQNGGFFQRASEWQTGFKYNHISKNGGFLQIASEGQTGFKYNKI